MNGVRKYTISTTTMALNVLHSWFLLLLSWGVCGEKRVWQTMYLDDDDNCHSYTSNDDLAEGDLYVVRSDNWDGAPTEYRRPAECTATFNFGVRLVNVRLMQWRCDMPDKSMYLDVYEDCDGTRGHLVKRFNCTSQVPATVLVESSCATLYYYRGKRRKPTNFFMVEVAASKEIIAFPVGGIAAIVIAIIVLIMLVFKVICVVTGCEETFPDEDMTDSDHRQLMAESSDTIYENQNFEPRTPQTARGTGPASTTWVRRDTQVRIGNGKPSVTFADDQTRTYGSTDPVEYHVTLTSSL